MDDAAAESVLVDELEIGARVVRQCEVPPTEDDWPDEQGKLVDQARDESLGCEVRATDQQIPTAAAFRSSTALGSKWRSSRVFAVNGAAKVEE